MLVKFISVVKSVCARKVWEILDNSIQCKQSTKNVCNHTHTHIHPYIYHTPEIWMLFIQLLFDTEPFAGARDLSHHPLYSENSPKMQASLSQEKALLCYSRSSRNKKKWPAWTFLLWNAKAFYIIVFCCVCARLVWALRFPCLRRGWTEKGRARRGRDARAPEAD